MSQDVYLLERTQVRFMALHCPLVALNTNCISSTRSAPAHTKGMLFNLPQEKKPQCVCLHVRCQIDRLLIRDW